MRLNRVTDHCVRARRVSATAGGRFAREPVNCGLSPPRSFVVVVVHLSTRARPSLGRRWLMAHPTELSQHPPFISPTHQATRTAHRSAPLPPLSSLSSPSIDRLSVQKSMPDRATIRPFPARHPTPHRTVGSAGSNSIHHCKPVVSAMRQAWCPERKHKRKRIKSKSTGWRKKVAHFVLYTL